MVHIRRSTLLLIFIITSMSVLLVWYYQKSTSVEDGALDLLDRYAQAQARIDELELRAGSRAH